MFMIVAVFTGAPPGVSTTFADTGQIMQIITDSVSPPTTLVGDTAESAIVALLDTSPSMLVVVNSNTMANAGTTFSVTVGYTDKVTSENQVWAVAWAANMRSNEVTLAAINVLDTFPSIVLVVNNNTASTDNSTFSTTVENQTVLNSEKENPAWAVAWAANMRSAYPTKAASSPVYYGRGNAQTALVFIANNADFSLTSATSAGMAHTEGGCDFGHNSVG
jgi:hypothetical protein